MLHFYDQSTDSIETQCLRLAPALAITRANIPCLVWAEDALSFVYFVPTSLFALQLLVPDEDLEKAALTITSSLPYERIYGAAPGWLEMRMVDPAQPSCFPNSIYLRTTKLPHLRHEDDPEEIYLHPQSFFSVDIRQHDRSVSLSTLPKEYADIRFPTRAAFLDALFDTLLDPPSGLRVLRLTLKLDVYISYIAIYTLRKYPVLSDGELEPEHAAVRDSLREEHRRIFEARMNPGGRLGWWAAVQLRRDLLKNTSRFAAAQRPLPLNTMRHMSIMEKTASSKLEASKSFHTSAVQSHRRVPFVHLKRPLSRGVERGVQHIARYFIR
ncbi:hypothetical protein D9615_007282 [Tricholomella constricta]|uniref:Uncharacterized protein n=1 Tax=Tricholomella constricta TaxID=117010 RepID=A0A8H5H542_9AGAR|nr:hypothetical protein D9615_007282 [Tricholomella constricta]